MPSAPSAPSVPIVPDAAPTTPAAPAAQYQARGQLSVSWTVPAGDFTPVTGISLQILTNDSVAGVRNNVSSPLILSDLDPGTAYRFQVRATNQQGTSDWSPPSDAITPSGTPAAPSGLTSTFVSDAGRRGIAYSWSAPVDTGGEPVRGYRLTLSTGATFTGGGGFLSQFVPVSTDTPVSASVVASNSRGDGPPAVGAPVTAVRPAGRGRRPRGGSGGPSPARDVESGRFAWPADRSLRLPVGRRRLGVRRCAAERDDRFADERPDLHRRGQSLQRRDPVRR